ncbi:phage tail protein [Sphingomonas sp. ST-64]|uniref:Phage tail protein n=1 Tax=Sphingomonas plantiphila TaxID=3163295 RepID=A0ABW8YI42_9SPHN
MATLVLTTVGGIFGGPIGAMLGGLVGQSVDRELLFKPKGREGPRLTELALQTSSYGTPIPQLFGTMRVAGSVIWATDLVEHRQREGGKGRPTVTSYSYTASFAVALSARPILSVGRIWADGKLLRGAAGDWKARTGFRLHLGGEDQAVDPLIASAEGIALAPAHRGIAYAVFEDLELADYGNRIPSLTFEVTADTGPVSAGAVIEQVSRGAVLAGEGGPAIGGFSAYGGSVRAVVEPLAQACGAWPVIADGRLAMAAGDGASIPVRDRGADARGQERRSIATPDRAPRTVTLSHYDPARDYQAGVQRASWGGGQDRELRIELPAALSASHAKQLAHAALSRADADRTLRTVATGWEGLAIVPGARVAIDGESGRWRVVETRIEAGGVQLQLAPLAPAALAAPAVPGRVIGAPDVAQGRTIVHAFELPPLTDGALSAPRVLVAASGDAPGWRKAVLATSSDGGARWEPAGATAQPAVIGAVVTPAGAASAAIADRRSRLVVALAHEEMALGDADPEALASGTNLALVGDELIQFAQAEPLGGGQWALTGLWRGRRGTEDAIGTGRSGDRFVLIEAGAIMALDGLAGIGATLTVMATGVGDPEAVETQASVTGRSVTPPAPVALHAVPMPDGGRRLRWTRRSRIGWRWSDGSDAPLGESVERYQIRIRRAGLPDQLVSADLPELILPSEGVGTGALTIEVRQAGDLGLSPAAILVLDNEPE